MMQRDSDVQRPSQIAAPTLVTQARAALRIAPLLGALLLSACGASSSNGDETSETAGDTTTTTTSKPSSTNADEAPDSTADGDPTADENPTANDGIEPAATDPAAEEPGSGEPAAEDPSPNSPENGDETDATGSDETPDVPAAQPPTIEPVEVDTGLAEDRPLTSLSEEEFRQVCETIAESFSSTGVQVSQCEGTAALLSALVATSQEEFEAACTNQLAGCTAENEQTPETTLDCEMDPSEDLDPACQATVGDYETCVGTALGSYQAVFGGISCESKLEDAQASALAALAVGDSSPITSSPACAAVDACSSDDTVPPP